MPVIHHAVAGGALAKLLPGDVENRAQMPIWIPYSLWTKWGLIPLLKDTPMWVPQSSPMMKAWLFQEMVMRAFLRSNRYALKPNGVDQHPAIFLDACMAAWIVLKEDIAKVLVVFPEMWSRSKRQYVRLVPKALKDQSNSPLWLGHKYDFSPNRNKAKIGYDDDDIRKLESAPDFSFLQVRSDRGEFRFEKKNEKWVQTGEI